MSTVAEIAAAEGASTKAVLRQAVDDGLSVTQVQVDNLNAPQTTSVTSDVRSFEPRGRPRDRRH